MIPQVPRPSANYDHSTAHMPRAASQASDSEDFQFLENLTISAGNNSEGDEPEDTIFARATEESLHGPPIQPSSPTARGHTAWVVFNGRNVGIYQTWEATSMQVDGYSGAWHRGYKTYDEVWAAWVHAQSNNVVGPSPHITTSISVPSPQRSTDPPPRVPDVCPLPSDRSPPLPVQEPRRPSPEQVLPHTPRPVLRSLPSVTSYAGHLIVINRRIGGPHMVFKLSDEEAYWVVIAGANPGVYHGKTAASAAMGTRGSHQLLRAGSRDQADRAFTEKFMQGEIYEIIEAVQADAE